jgi:subtilisin family serine protease
LSVRSARPLADLADFLHSAPGQSLAGEINLPATKILPGLPGTALVDVALTAAAEPLAVVGQLAAVPIIAWAAPDYVYGQASSGDARDFVPDDPHYSSQYFHPLIHDDWSWDVTQGDPHIVVAVTDDGIDLLHEDLYDNVWINPGEIPASRRANLTDVDGDGLITVRDLNAPVNQGPFKISDQNGNGRIDALDLLAPMKKDASGNDVGTGGWADGTDGDGNGYVDDLTGWDFSSGDNNPSEGAGASHGTHVAGILAAHTDNGVGVAGTAGGVTIMPLRFFGSGTWTSAQVYQAYAYAADNGARILSTSYNVDGFVGDPTFEAALNYMYAKGVLHFNSAGNNAQSNPPRAQYDQTLYVVATNAQDQKASYSNYGYDVDIAAPGDGIYSTLPNNTYGTMSGTSMATPNAAGVAALIWSAHPDWTREQVAAQLWATADNIDAQNPGYAGLLGAGRVDSYRALLEPIGPPRFKAVLGLPRQNGITSGHLGGFQIDVANVFDPATVMNPANWELRGAGPDGRFDTADDLLIPITLTTTYMVGTNRLSFTVGANLPPGRYQFRAYSGGLADPFGQPLDGNGDGVGGDRFVRSFAVVAPISLSLSPLVSTPRSPVAPEATAPHSSGESQPAPGSSPAVFSARAASRLQANGTEGRRTARTRADSALDVVTLWPDPLIGP